MTWAEPPPLDSLLTHLASECPELLPNVERRLADLPKRCVYLSSTRRGDRSPSMIRRLLGASSVDAVLPPLASKFGGVPYSEQSMSWKDRRFIGQIDLSCVGALIGDPRLSGLVRLDYAGGNWPTAKWYREPSITKFRPPGSTYSTLGKYETEIVMRPGWTLPQSPSDIMALAPNSGVRDDLLEIWHEAEVPGYNEDDQDPCHRVLGWFPFDEDELYAFEPPPGCSDRLADYAMLIRLTFDNAADFHWGSNCMYVLVPRTGLECGDLSQLVCTGANL